MPCSGKNVHCCYVRGAECEHLIRDYTDENGQHRDFACGLYAELRDWDKVLADPRYPDAWAEGVNCRDWPEGPEKWRGCNTCGACK